MGRRTTGQPAWTGQHRSEHSVWIASLNLGCALDNALEPIIEHMLKESYLVLAFQDAKRLPLTAGYPIPHGFSVVHSDGQFPCGFILAPAIDPLTSRFTQHDEEGRIVSLVVHSIGAVLISAYAPVEGPNKHKQCQGM